MTSQVRYLRVFRVFLLYLAIAGACVAWAADTVKTETTSTYTNEALLTQMLVVDVSERTLEGSPALAMTFSQDLEPTAEIASFITLTAQGKAVEGTWVLASDPRRLYFTNIQPETEYRVQVRPGVASTTKLQLQRPVDRTVKTRPVQAAFDFATRGSVLPAKLTAGLPIRVVNVDAVDMEFLRVQPDKLPEVLSRLRLDGSLQYREMEYIHSVTESVFASRYATNAKKNAPTSVEIPVETIPALQPPGLYFAVMRQPGRFGDNAFRITPFVVTNIGLHVRLYPRGLEVFANALDTGKPLSGVTLQLRGEKESEEVTTDEQGHASFVHRPDGDLLLTASLDQQFAFLDMREAALALAEYPVTGGRDQAIVPFIYSSRDLYRPDEVMDLAVLLRDRDGFPVSLDRLNLRLVRPDNNVFVEENLLANNSKLGFFSYNWTIPADAATGEWKAEVRSKAEDAAPLSTFRFQVGALLPERLKLSLKPQVPVVMAGEKLLVAVQGDYAYGLPAIGAKFNATRLVTVNRHPLADYKDYYFGDPADATLTEREELPEIQLNETGSAFLDVPALTGKVNSPLRWEIVGNLHEAGGQTVTRKFEEAFWPAPSLVGIRPQFTRDTVAANSDVGFDLVRVSSTGQAATTDKPLAVTLVREEKTFFWEYNDANGWQRKAIASEYPLLQQKIPLDTQGRASALFSLKQGSYHLEVEDSETGLKTVYPFHAGWDQGVAGNTTARAEQIALALDKPSYRAGEVAQLTITPPVAGEAIVAVEGESMLWSQRVSLPVEGAQVEIPLDKTWNRHDLYITVTSFSPADAQQKIAPKRALGVIFLPLERGERKLNLSLDAPETVLPEQTLSVTVTADNLAKQPAIVTLAAVDTGVLNTSNFKTPDPFAFYFAQHTYAPKMYDAYGKIITGEQLATPLQNVSGAFSAQGEGGVPAEGVRIVSLFSGAVEFNAEGKAQIRLPIPAFEGALRLMAVAASADRFGNAEREVKVTSPVAVNLSAPRFLAVGDSSVLTVDLQNTTDLPQNVNLKMTTESPLTLASVAQDVSLDKGKHQILTFPLTAQQALGTGNIQLTLTGKSFSTQRQLPLSVRAVYPQKHVSQASELKPGESMVWESKTLQGFTHAGLNVNVSIAASPVLPLRSVLQGLLQDTYGSLEQTTSNAWAYLFLENDVTEHLGLNPLDMSARKARVNAAMLRLAGMQLANGGFSLWDSRGAEEYWLTPYVTDFLLDAQMQGFAVPDGLLQGALKNLQERVQENDHSVDSRYRFSDMPEHLDFAARAYAAYVLARQKQVPLGVLRVMYDKDNGNAVARLPLIHLGLALIAMGDSQRGNEAIQKGLNLVRDDSLYAGDYGSQLRDDAAVLYLLLRHNVTIPQQAAHVTEVADLLRNRATLSTQEQLFVFLAGLQVQATAKESWKAKLTTSTGSVELLNKGMQSRALSVEEIQQGVTLTSTSDKPIYVDLSLDGYPDQLPPAPANPIEVKREWFTMQGKKVIASDLKVGDVLLTHLVVTSTAPVNDALVVDLLPAGFVLEETNLATNAPLQSLPLEGVNKPVAELLKSSSPRMQAGRDNRYVAALPLKARTHHHLFYRVRVASTGTFISPPTYVTDMYRPTINALGASEGMLSPKP